MSDFGDCGSEMHGSGEMSPGGPDGQSPVRAYGVAPPRGAVLPPPLGPLSRPVDRATSHAYESPEQIGRLGRGEEVGAFYPRLAQTNGMAVEAKVAELEGADGAVLFGSGMAASSAVFLALCNAGDRVLVAQEVYGGTDVFVSQELPRFGVEVERFRLSEPRALEQALAKGARLVWVESPVNPLLRMVDLQACAKLAHGAGAILACDGTFAPPPLQHALRHGVDLVMHSATKFLGGHSDVLAGVVAGRHEHLESVARWRTRTGGVLAADAAALLERSLMTLSLRVEAQQAHAREVARRVAHAVGHGSLLRVVHPGDPDHPDREIVARQLPGGGALLGMEVSGGLSGARDVARRLRVIARAPSLGGVESVVSLPADTTHAAWTAAQRQAAGIPEGWLRISVGLEAPDRLATDLLQAVGVQGT